MIKCFAIGSLPHTKLQDAFDLVQNTFEEILFWPQLPKFNKNEGIDRQFTDGLPSFLFSDTLNSDFEEIVFKKNFQNLEKYSITKEFSSTFEHFSNISANYKISKVQITGFYTLSKILGYFEDKNLCEQLAKFLILKAIWQKSKICSKEVIILFDEPLLCELKTTEDKNFVTKIIKNMSKFLQEFGYIVGVHCCSCCDWDVVLNADVNIINPDIYNYQENFLKFYKSIEQFLLNNGKIAWGIVPTTPENLRNTDITELSRKFDEVVTNLTNCQINEKLIMDSSYITQSCGMGLITVDLAEKAFKLTKELTKILNTRYNDSKISNYR